MKSENVTELRAAAEAADRAAAEEDSVVDTSPTILLKANVDGHGTFEVEIGEAAKVTLAVWCDCVHVFVSLLHSAFALLPLISLWSSQSLCCLAQVRAFCKMVVSRLQNPNADTRIEYLLDATFAGASMQLEQ